MFYYKIHGLTIQSEIKLPELRELITSAKYGSRTANVKISLGKVDSSNVDIISEGIFRVASHYILTKDSIFLIWNDLEVCEIRNQSEIIVNIDSKIQENFLRSLILGPALGIVLHLKGLMVLHASAVDINGEAVAIMGHNGMGKSTTTMALIGEGYPLIVDDILSIEFDSEENPVVNPGIARIKLWPEVYPKYVDHIKNIDIIHPESPKRSCQLKRQSEDKIPLKHVYILEKDSVMGLCDVNYSEALMELIRNSYCASIFQDQDEISHFQGYAKVVRRVPVKYLKRYDSLDDLKKLAELIINDVESQK